MPGFIKFIFATIRFLIRVRHFWLNTKARVRRLFTWNRGNKEKITVDTSEANYNSNGGKRKVFEPDEGTYVDFVEEKD